MVRTGIMFRITTWWIFACVPTLGCARTSPLEWLRQLGPGDVIYCTDRASNKTYELTEEGKQTVRTELLNATDFDSLPPGQGPVHAPFVVEFDLRIELESGETHTLKAVYPNCFRLD